MGSLHKDLKVKLRSNVLSQTEMGSTDQSDGVTVSEPDITDPVAVKSVPPRRRTKSNIRILRDNKVICSSEEILNDNGMVMDEVKADQLVSGDPENSSKVSTPGATEKVILSILIICSKSSCINEVF